MMAGDSGQLLQDFLARREVIAARWNRAIAQSSFVPFSLDEVRRRLAELTERVVRVVLSEPFNRSEAQAIGAALADLRYVHPESLGGTLEALGGELLAGLPADRVLALQQRLAAVLGRLAAGFYAEARGTILAEQETIRAALLVAQREAEAALWASEARFRAIFDAAAVGIGLAHLDGRIFETNRALQAMFGYSADDLSRLNVADFARPDESASDRHRFQDLATGQRDHYVIERQFYRKDGVAVWCHLTASLVRDTERHPRFTIALMVDVTERKRAQEAVSQLNAELERRVAERTEQLAGINQELAEEIGRRALAEAELQRLNADLERRVADRTAELAAANQELEGFAYSVAHDLRTPLRGINGFSVALREEYASQLDASGLEYLQQIQTGTQKMGQLIDDLLALSRVTRREMQRSSVDLSGLVASIVQDLRERDAERVVDVTIAAGVAAEGDPHLLRIALQNLVENAWKFTGKREAGYVAFGVADGDGPRVYYLRDNGAGFDMAHVGRLFGVFQRLHQQSEYPGTGIGLVTVQRIVQRHGGAIWAEGAVDHGATFYFTLSDGRPKLGAQSQPLDG
jgi:PAS domain S-box-containing protein